MSVAQNDEAENEKEIDPQSLHNARSNVEQAGLAFSRLSNQLKTQEQEAQEKEKLEQKRAELREARQRFEQESREFKQTQAELQQREREIAARSAQLQDEANRLAQAQAEAAQAAQAAQAQKQQNAEIESKIEARIEQEASAVASTIRSQAENAAAQIVENAKQEAGSIIERATIEARSKSNQLTASFEQQRSEIEAEKHRISERTQEIDRAASEAEQRLRDATNEAEQRKKQGDDAKAQALVDAEKIVTDARAEAEQIVIAARAEAQKIIDEATNKAKQIIDEAQASALKLEAEAQAQANALKVEAEAQPQAKVEAEVAKPKELLLQSGVASVSIEAEPESDVEQVHFKLEHHLSTGSKSNANELDETTRDEFLVLKYNYRVLATKCAELARKCEELKNVSKERDQAIELTQRLAVLTSRYAQREFKQSQPARPSAQPSAQPSEQGDDLLKSTMFGFAESPLATSQIGGKADAPDAPDAPDASAKASDIDDDDQLCSWCEDDGKRTKAQFYCPDCDHFYCNKCDLDCHSDPEIADHARFNIDISPMKVDASVKSVSAPVSTLVSTIRVCDACNAEQEDSTGSFCENCGNKLSEIAQPIQPATKPKSAQETHMIRASLIKWIKANRIDKIKEKIKDGEISSEDIDEIRDDHGLSPLHIVSLEAQTEILAEFLKLGASLYEIDDEGRTPLHAATARIESLDCIFRHVQIQRIPLEVTDNRNRTPIFNAIYFNNVASIQMLCNSKANLSHVDSSGFSPLFYAARLGRYESVNCLLKNKADFMFRGPRGQSALHAAVLSGNVQVVKLFVSNCSHDSLPGIGYLIDAKANTPLHYAAKLGVDCATLLPVSDVDAKNSRGDTALHLAARFDKVNAINQLMMYCSHSSKNNLGETPLHVAVLSGSVAAVKAILKNSSNSLLADVDMYGRQALHLAAWKCRESMLTFLLGTISSDDDLDVLAVDRKGLSVLHWAAASTTPDTDLKITALIDFGLDINARDSLQRTPLHCAVLANSEDALITFVELGADLHAVNDKGANALMLAALTGNFESILFLQEKAEDLAEQHDNRGNTLVHYAAFGFDNMADLELNPTSLNAKNSKGLTPLHRAAGSGKLNNIIYLFENTNEIDPRDNKGRTPLHHATACNQIDAIELLLKHGADIDAADSAGYTSLMLAAENSTDSLSALLENGANPDLKNLGGFTALHCAVRELHMSAVRMLLGSGCSDATIASARELALEENDPELLEMFE